MNTTTLTGIHIYPVKSMRGMDLDRAELLPRGLAYDRRWMLTDSEGRFLTQRQIPSMALVQPRLSDDTLILSLEGHEDLHLPATLDQGPRYEVQVWADSCTALAAGGDANAWLSSALGQEVQLVYMPDDSERQVDEDYARRGDITSFADGFPFLLISEASLRDLNARLQIPLPMQRFRPNLVVSGCEAYAEDDWKRLRIGACDFEVVKPCSRCVITTIDPDTGIRGIDREPLLTLATYRRRDNGVYFGQNLIHRDLGTLNIGDQVEILE